MRTFLLKKAGAMAKDNHDLSKLSKKDLLEIMLKQGEEIDSLREQVRDLQAKLNDKEIKIAKAGSLAEASLAVTGIFEEAQKAANLYLQNARRMIDENTQNQLRGREPKGGAGGNE